MENFGNWKRTKLRWCNCWRIWSKVNLIENWNVHLGKHWAANSRGQGTPAACKATRQGTWAQDIWSGTWKPVRPPVRTLGVGEKVSRLTLEQERVGVSVCKSEGAVLLEQGGTLLPVLKSWKVENLWKFGGLAQVTCPLGLLSPILTGPIGAPFRAWRIDSWILMLWMCLRK